MFPQFVDDRCLSGRDVAHRVCCKNTGFLGEISLINRSNAPGLATSDKCARRIQRCAEPVSLQRGFSLLELLIVVAIIMVVGAITFETMVRAVQTMRLRESAINYSNLLQQARIRAVRDDKYYTVLTATGTGGPFAFVDIAGTGVYAPGDPMMLYASGVTPMAFGSAPALANLEAQFLPPDPSSVLTVNTTAPGPSFGPRGLPCTPTSAGPTATCPYLTLAGVPTSYISFMQNQQNQKWEAVTVTPAGRIRQYQFENGSWSSLN